MTVNDVTLPNITCPPNIVQDNAPGLCGAVVTYPTPIATDNCSISSVVLQSGLASSVFYPVGLTTNVWRATDPSNNTRTCSFTVRVNDVEEPTATCPPDRSVNTDPGQCIATLTINGGLALADNCGISSTSNNAPSPFPLGETVVTWTVSDPSGNTGTCTFLVTVTDAEFPQVQCPNNISTLTDLEDCAATVNFNVTASDNCGLASTDLSEQSGSAFPIGWTNIEFAATDFHGNVSTCFFQIIVNTRPEICNDFDDDCDGWVDEAEDWVALVKRFAADGAAAEEYGVSVDIDGDYAIVGSNQKNASGQSVGSAYILFRDKSGDNKWGQVIEITPPTLSPGDNFGASVAISGGVAAVGAPLFDDQFGNQGAVFLFQQNANNPAQWDFLKMLLTNDPSPADNFGASVALDGDRLLAGSPLNDQSGNNSGAAYVFYRNLGGADNWGQVVKILATTGAADDNMGVSVALDGDFAIVGANGVDGLLQNTGASYIFGRNQFGPDAWGQVAKIRANQAGQNDNFGASVGISGSWAIVGADRNDLKGADAGAAFIFYKNQNGISNSWGQRQILLDYNGQAGDRFGTAVGIDEPYAVVTAKGDNPFGVGSGRGFVYLLDGGSWVQVEQLTDGGGQANDAMGSTAAISGRNIILGAPLDNNGLNADQGAVLVYGGLCNDQIIPGGDSRDDMAMISETLVRCFPVPFSDVLNIELKGMKSSDAHLTIINAMGQVISDLHKGAIEGDMLFQWQPTQAADGLYFLRMVTGSKVVTQTIIRNR
ncbi:MAG: HYR domain-containing protein [Lewinellaceae bacterium]|nr:HYR domain-containing protein [Lewinellaceae bacterium]